MKVRILRNGVSVVGVGNNLKEACVDWLLTGVDFDDEKFMKALKESCFWNDKCNDDVDQLNASIDAFVDYLPSRKLFNLLNDGNFNWEVEQ